MKSALPEEKRLYAHGQGYDLVERPAIRDDEPMKLKANMNITIHPITGSKTAFAWVCDNYLLTEKGASECLHKTPKKIFGNSSAFLTGLTGPPWRDLPGTRCCRCYISKAGVIETLFTNQVWARD